MVQVHTVYEGYAWRNKVDGLQQGIPYADRTTAVAAGRLIAIEVGAALYLHDVDGTVLDHCVYEPSQTISALGAMRYTA